MKNITLQRLILLLIATAIGIVMATQCKAQTPTYIPDCCAQARQLANHGDTVDWRYYQSSYDPPPSYRDIIPPARPFGFPASLEELEKKQLPIPDRVLLASIGFSQISPIISLTVTPIALPSYFPDPRAQLFVLTRQLATARDSLTLLNTRVDTLLAADKRVRVALKAEADAAAAEANARLTMQEGQLGNVGGMLAIANARADKAEADLSRYRPRTWVGRQLRHVWNVAAWVGLGTVGYTVLRVFVFR